jgi:hypothetical protein
MADAKFQAAEDYMRAEDVASFQAQIEQRRRDDEKVKAFSIQRMGKAGKTATDRGELKPMDDPTWRAQVPILRDFEYWRMHAARYPYIEKSDEHNAFFLRGVTCHPRLSDYPMCKDIISDYFACREQHRFLGPFNICTALKEQMSACINLVFVKNHERAGKKLNKELREDYQEQKRDRRLRTLSDKAHVADERRNKFID